MYNVAAQIYKESGQNHHPIMYDVAAQIYKESGQNYHPTLPPKFFRRSDKINTSSIKNSTLNLTEQNMLMNEN